MKNKGFGTNFHQVYASDPQTYHIFSTAEHFPQELTTKINSLLTSGTLLDVAAGTCHKTDIFSKNFEVVYALDTSQPFLEFARQKYRSNKKLHFLWSSADNMPLLDKSVDSVLVTWGSFPLSQGIKEMKRVVKKGGTIVRIGTIAKDDFTSLFPNFDINRIYRINRNFVRHGFTIERHRTVIRFKNLSQAKEVLSKVTGAPIAAIDRLAYNHEVALCYYKKQ